MKKNNSVEYVLLCISAIPFVVLLKEINKTVRTTNKYNVEEKCLCFHISCDVIVILKWSPNNTCLLHR
jgi:hypothetical protein